MLLCVLGCTVPNITLGGLHTLNETDPTKYINIPTSYKSRFNVSCPSGYEFVFDLGGTCGEF